jgi:hypothetical protein
LNGCLAKDPEALFRSTRSFRAADRAAISRTMMGAAPAAILDANTSNLRGRPAERSRGDDHPRCVMTDHLPARQAPSMTK